MISFLTLLKKEVLRFWNVGFQTIAAPVLSALLYQLIFSHVLNEHVEPYPGVSYTAFLIPGLAMMSMTQNAFANASSSLIQSKIMGNLVFLLLSPITNIAFYAAYVGAAILRGLIVGVGVILVTIWFVDLPIPKYPLWLFVFAFVSCGIMGTFGFMAGIYSDKFDHLASFQSFIIMPMTFLSGVFYSIHSLPPVWHVLSRFNPVFYMIDGFRFGFFGVSDASPYLSLLVLLVSLLVLSAISLYWLRSGYKLRQMR